MLAGMWNSLYYIYRYQVQNVMSYLVDWYMSLLSLWIFRLGRYIAMLQHEPSRLISLLILCYLFIYLLIYLFYLLNSIYKVGGYIQYFSLSPGVLSTRCGHFASNGQQYLKKIFPWWNMESQVHQTSFSLDNIILVFQSKITTAVHVYYCINEISSYRTININ